MRSEVEKRAPEKPTGPALPEGFLLLREGLPSLSGHQRRQASDKFYLTVGSLPVLSCPVKAKLNLSFRRELPVVQEVAWPPLPEVVGFSLFFQEC